MNNIFGGGSSDTSGGSPVDLTGGGSSDPFGGSGGSDLGTLFSTIGQAFAGGGATPGSPAQTIDAIQNATDPSGSIAATNAITSGQGGANAPQPTQNQNPQGPQGQQGGADQFAPPSAVEALKKALTGLRQEQRQNPYAFPGQAPAPGSGQNSPMLNRAGRIPTDQVPNAPAQPDDPNAPSQFASAMEFSNDNPPPPQPNAIDPADAVRAGLRSNAPDTSGQFKIPGPANENAPSENFPAYLKNLREGGGAAPAPAPEVPPQTPPSPLPTGGGGGGGILSTLAGLAPGSLGELAARMGGPLGVFLGSTSPAETGEMPQQTLGRSPSGPAPAPELPKSEVLREGEGGPATTTAPVTGKKVETVDPKTKKPVDPKTGDPLPTKTGKLPTKKGPPGEYQPATGNARDKTWHPGTSTGMDQRVGPIMRDVSGVSHGVPLPLGQLAQMALPLLMMAMGGMGGGGRGRRGFGGMGHPGGRGMWPYHHPTFGWQAHGFHPGGGWRPMHPVHFREMRGGGPMGYAGGDGMTGNPALDAILQGMGGGGQQGAGQGGQPQSGGRQGGGSGNQWGYSDPQTEGPWSANPFLNTVVGAESSGRNSGAPGGGPGGDGGIARGFYNIQTPTWGEFARGVPGASRYASADQAPPDIQTQVAMTIPAARFGERTRAILHAKFGNFDERMTLGQLADQFGGADWAANKPQPGATTTGGSKAPNPQGNPVATTQSGPEGVANAT
jgi:hypothetical protein